jgi:hypothetical protein
VESEFFGFDERIFFINLATKPLHKSSEYVNIAVAG